MAADFHPIRLPDSLSDGMILLDAHTPDDAEPHWRGEDDEMRRRFDAIRPATLEEIRGAVQRWIDYRAAGGPQFAYALRQPSGTLMGGCELQRRTADRAHVSYWTYPAFRGHGYGARALALLCAAATAEIAGIERFEAHIEPDNLASRRVAEKNGFVETGVTDDEAWHGATVRRLVFERPAGMARGV
jgi:RimJ/RimL family protein N-acetyltransferase